MLLFRTTSMIREHDQTVNMLIRLNGQKYRCERFFWCYRNYLGKMPNAPNGSRRFPLLFQYLIHHQNTGMGFSWASSENQHLERLPLGIQRPTLLDAPPILFLTPSEPGVKKKEQQDQRKQRTATLGVKMSGRSTVAPSRRGCRISEDRAKSRFIRLLVGMNRSPFGPRTDLSEPRVQRRSGEQEEDPASPDRRISGRPGNATPDLEVSSRATTSSKDRGRRGLGRNQLRV